MKLLIDTQALIWYVAGDPRLSATATGALRDRRHSLHVSIATFWEIAIKLNLGKLRLDAPLERFIETVLEAYAMEMVAVTPDHTQMIATLPNHHRDPFDRMIAVQTLAGGYTLVSADAVFEQYGVERLW